jgi:hypothetical protein
MKTSMLMKIVAALAIGAAFPFGAIAAQPVETTTERGVIQKVKAPRKHYFAHNWLESGGRPPSGAPRRGASSSDNDGML